MLRELDSSVVAWTKTHIIPVGNERGENLKAVFAKPERAFSAMNGANGLLTRSGQAQIQEPVPNPDHRLVPLPFASVARYKEPVLDRVLYSKRAGIGIWNDSLDGRTTQFTNWPTAYRVGYQIELWSFFMNEINALEESMIGDFDPDYFYYQQSTPFGIKLLYLQLVEVTNNSDLQASQDDRLIRRTFTLDAIGWLFKPTITVNPDGSITRSSINADGSVNNPPSATVSLINTVNVDYYDLSQLEPLQV